MGTVQFQYSVSDHLYKMKNLYVDEIGPVLGRFHA